MTRKLEHFVRLSDEDRRALDVLAGQHVRECRARADLIREGDKPEHVKPILQGWACGYKVMEDGRRQIVSFFVPGDLCDLNVYILRAMDHSIGAITPVSYAQISREAFEEATEGRTRLLQALWWDTLVSSAIQREWIANIGQRGALERIAHLLLELFHRLEAVGLTRGDSCDMPITQTELADALGMTAVHINRVIQELRGAGLIELTGKQLVITDRAGLGDQMTLEWVEHLRPGELRGPVPSGFGTELLEQTLPYVLGAGVTFDVGATAVRCVIRLPDGYAVDEHVAGEPAMA